MITNKLEQITGTKIKKYNCQSIWCYTYEGLSWIALIYISICSIVFFYPVVIVSHNFPAYIGFLFIFIYPPILMILRKNTFSDNSIPSARTPVYVGPNRISGGPGYNSMYYFLFSLAIGLTSTVRGFSMLNFPDAPLNQAIILIITGLIGQTLILFPDKINKISPIDTRTRKGVFLMTGITITIILILLTIPVII